MLKPCGAISSRSAVHRPPEEPLKVEELLVGELLEVADVADRDDHDVTRVVGVLVEHDVAELRSREDALGLLAIADPAEKTPTSGSSLSPGGSAFAAWMYSIRHGTPQVSISRRRSD